MKDTELRKIVDNTIKWANDLSESWVGTTTGRVIDRQKELVEDLMVSKDFNLAEIAVSELAQTCDYAEKELDG